MRSLLIVLRDGVRVNVFFGSEQLPLVESYESCVSQGRAFFKLSDLRNFSERPEVDHRLLVRFDEILDGHPRFDTEFELQDQQVM